MLAAAFRRIFQAGAFVAACMVAVTMAAAAAPLDAPLKAGVESAVHGLLTDLFAERPSGRVQWVQGSNEVILNFPGAVAALDSEYLILRPADPGTHGFARTVGVVRIAELQKEIAELGVTLQMHGAREYGPGDTVPIYFGLGNATSTFDSEKTLSMIGNSARRGVKLVHVGGHSDTVGTYESNMDLSEARAQLIANRLGKLGFEVSSIGWRGEQELLEITHDEVDEPRNRRVDVVLE